MDDALVDGVKRFFSEKQLVELTLAVAAYNLTNRFNLALGVDLEETFERVLRDEP